jgi:hypothetical protein
MRSLPFAANWIAFKRIWTQFEQRLECDLQQRLLLKFVSFSEWENSKQTWRVTSRNQQQALRAKKSWQHGPFTCNVNTG